MAGNGIRAVSPAELCAAEDVDVVLNLTVPQAHAEVAHTAIRAGSILDAAAQAGVRVGCAPDTVLGTGIQTARHHLDAGAIGTPVAAIACMVSAGPEVWHPAPESLYRTGGGPLLDMVRTT